MNRLIHTVLVLVAGLVLPTVVAPAAAQSGDERLPHQFGERDPVTLDPNTAYIFFRTPARLDYRFIREVTEEERVAWTARRAEAMVRARERYPRAMEGWRYRRANCAGSGSDTCRDRADRERPVWPTEQSFAFPPPELDNMIGLSRRRIMNDRQWSAWLVAVRPGTYTFYGEFVTVPNGTVSGTCMCMGSIRFEAAAGRITDVGELRVASDDQRGDPNLQSFRVGELGAFVPYDPSMRRPASLDGLNVVAADLHAADKMPNYLGVMISRLASIPGVLEYRRDVVIDGRTGRPVEEQAMAPSVVAAAGGSSPR